MPLRFTEISESNSNRKKVNSVCLITGGKMERQQQNT